MNNSATTTVDDIIWSGWNGLGDKEIVREASAKGTHVELAYKFLEKRKNCTLQEAKDYFIEQVNIWVDALLNKKQIHRASHVLRNVGIVPADRIKATCLECTEPELRDYLAKHVESRLNLDEQRAWELIRLIEKHQKNDEFFFSSSIFYEEQQLKCLNDVINLSQSLKDEIYVNLYFNSHEPSVVSNLKNYAVWNFLLINGKIDLIKFWIDIEFGNKNSENDDDDDDDVYIFVKGEDKLQANECRSLFKNLKITDEMIARLHTTMPHVNNLILDHLCSYGIFTTTESKDNKLVLSRLFEQGTTAERSDFLRVLSKPLCNVDKEKFFSEIDSIEFLRNYDDDVESRNNNAKIKQLYDCLRLAFCKNTTADVDYMDLFESTIIETINYLSDDPIQYLNHNSIVLFTLMFLRSSTRKQTSFKDLLSINDNSNIELTIKSLTLKKDTLKTMIVNLPYLKYEIDKVTVKNNVTMYELIDDCINLNCSTFFKWRFLENNSMPTFRSENLIKKYGHKEKLSHLNYLKEARPNMAVFIFHQQQEKLSGGRVTSKAKFQASLSAHIFALRNLSDNLEIVGSCVSFLEILGIDSQNLRLHLTIARFVKKELKISIENQLESMVYDNEVDLKSVMNYAERSYRQSRLNVDITKESSENLIEALRDWELLVKLARAHHASLPSLLLKYLASRNAWFEFILVANIFLYPINQITDCAENFDNWSLKNHLLLALNNNNSDPREEHKLDDIDDQKRSDFSLKSSTTEKKNCDTTTSANLTPITIKDDLWLIILKCHQSADPPGALLNASRVLNYPILIVLATCYEPLSISSYLYSWLVVSVKDADFAVNFEENMTSQTWLANTVLDLFVAIGSSDEFVDTLYRGLYIFLPENPLKLFFQFLEQCLVHGNFQDHRYLSDFIAACSNYKGNKLINWDCCEATSYLENIYWIQTVVVKCIIGALATLQSSYVQMELLKVLIKCDLDKKLVVDSPKFEYLLDIAMILQQTKVTLNYLCFDTTKKILESEADLDRCVDELIDSKDYSNALKLSAASSNLNTLKIVIARRREEFKRHVENNEKIVPEFWKRCAEDFVNYNVHYEKAVEFFIEHADKVKSHRDRYEVLKLALKILVANSQDRRLCDSVEIAMWKSYVLASPEMIEIEPFESGTFKNLKTELLSSVSDLQVFASDGQNKNGHEETLAIRSLIDRLLDAGQFKTALRISVMFNCKNRELQVLMLCLSLAEGETLPHNLTNEQKALISNASNAQRNNTLFRTISYGFQRYSSSSSPTTSEAAKTLLVSEKQQQLDCLYLLNDLVETLSHGVDIGVRILLCYRLSVQLEKRYQVLLTWNDPMQLFRQVIERFELARDVIMAYQIDRRTVANFLADEIVARVTRVIEDGHSESTDWKNYNLNLQSVVEMCKDASILGSILLDRANILLGNSNGEKRNLVTLKIIVELLIRSHDCFTASCNMEGIASVLRKCQQISNALQNLKHWSTLVRLVTGIGRFTEMNYCFKILQEHDHFEFLLGKGLDKVPGLRMALLEFLKRNCPKNKDLFNIVALHFRLYYEIALSWEKEAKDLTNELINEAKKRDGNTNVNNPQFEVVSFFKTEATEKTLELILANLTHAAQYFLQDKKLNLANRTANSAQLVALQISLCNSAQSTMNNRFPCILNLDKDHQLNKIICQNLNFSQALVLARAYDHHVDWASALYSHCLLKGDTKYLNDFVRSKRLTSAIAIDCARKYRSEKNTTRTMSENMRSLVNHLSDNECKYVLASQLGFKSIVLSMTDEPGIGAYLKDTVFKTGFVATEFNDR